MRCLYCGESLSLLRKLSGLGEFCSEAHRDAYQSEFNNLALGRLRQSRVPIPSVPAPVIPAEEPEEEFETTSVAVAAAPPEPPEGPYLVLATSWASSDSEIELEPCPAADPYHVGLEVPAIETRLDTRTLGVAPEIDLSQASEQNWQSLPGGGLARPGEPLEVLSSASAEAVEFLGEDIHLWMEPLALSTFCELGWEGPQTPRWEAPDPINTPLEFVSLKLRAIPATPVLPLASGAPLFSFDVECQGPIQVSEPVWEPQWNPRAVSDPVAIDLETSLGWTNTVVANVDFEDRRFEFVFRPAELPEWVKELQNAAPEPEQPETPPTPRPRRIIAARPKSSAIEAPGESGGQRGGGATVPPGFVAVPAGYIGGIAASSALPPPGATFSAPSGAQQGIPVQGVPVQGVPVQGVPVQGIPMQGIPVQGVPVQGAPFVAYAGSPGTAAADPAPAEPEPHVFHMPPAGGEAGPATATAGPVVLAQPILTGQPMMGFAAAGIPVNEGRAGDPQARQGFTMGAAPPSGGRSRFGVTVNTTVLVDGAEGSVTVQNGAKVTTSGSGDGKSSDAKNGGKETGDDANDEKGSGRGKLQVVEPAAYVAPTREPLNERTLRLNPKPMLQATLPVETPRLDLTPLRRPIAFGPVKGKPAEPPRPGDTLRAAAAKKLPAETKPAAEEKSSTGWSSRREDLSTGQPPAPGRNLKLAVILLIVTALIAFAFWKFTSKTTALGPSPGPTIHSVQKGTLA